MFTASLIGLFALPAHAQTEIACCDHEGVENVVLAVVDVAQALATTPRDAPGALRDLERAVKIDNNLPEVEKTALQLIKKTARSKRDKPDEALAVAGRQAIFLMLRHEGGDNTLAEAFCASQGAWLQAELDQVRSPWLDCGEWR